MIFSPYHAGFDTFQWMDQFGDPGWAYHLTSTKLWSLIAAHLSDSPVLDMKAPYYAAALERWVNDLSIHQSWFDQCDPESLYRAVARLGQAAKRFDHEVASPTLQPRSRGNPWFDHKFKTMIDAANQRYMRLERTF